MRSSSEDPGRAAEMRLQWYRYNVYRQRPLAFRSSEPDPGKVLQDSREALVWVEELAGSGHWGATLILRRAARDTNLPAELVKIDPEAAMRLARISQTAAQGIARAEAWAAAPDWERMRECLGLAKLQHLAAQLSEAERLCGSLEDGDIACVRATLDKHFSGAGELLVDMAEWRRAADDPVHRGRVEAMIDAAATMGSRRARRMLLDREWAGARDRAALVEAWCARYEASVPAQELRALLRVGSPLSPAELDLARTVLGDGLADPGSLLLQVARERHAAGTEPERIATLLSESAELAKRPEIGQLWEALWARASDRAATLAWWLERFPDFDLDKKRTYLVGLWIERSGNGSEAALSLAAQWYARAKGAPIGPGVPIPRSLCHFVAAYSNPNVSFRFADEPGVSLAWLERGIALGSESCLDSWFTACMRGQLGLAPDPDAAMDRLRRIERALPGQQDPLGGYTVGLAAFVAHARALLSGGQVPRDEAGARRWLAVAAEAGYKDAIERLAGLDKAAKA